MLLLARRKLVLLGFQRLLPAGKLVHLTVKPVLPAVKHLHLGAKLVLPAVKHLHLAAKRVLPAGKHLQLAQSQTTFWPKKGLLGHFHPFLRLSRPIPAFSGPPLPAPSHCPCS